jgi:hypothetical protein
VRSACEDFGYTFTFEACSRIVSTAAGLGPCGFSFDESLMSDDRSIPSSRATSSTPRPGTYGEWSERSRGSIPRHPAPPALILTEPTRRGHSTSGDERWSAGRGTVGMESASVTELSLEAPNRGRDRLRSTGE